MLVSDNEANATRLVECGGIEHSRDVLSVEMDALMGPQHLVVGTLWAAMHSHVSHGRARGQGRGCRRRWGGGAYVRWKSHFGGKGMSGPLASMERQGCCCLWAAVLQRG